MAEISASQIKELREKTGAGMLDCKKALVEAGGDIEAAVDWLRKKGLAAAAKKSGRTAAEGLVAIATEGSKGAMIELNSETDFVARNEQFQELAANIAALALKKGIGEAEALKASTCEITGKKVEEVIAGAIGTIGENMNLRRVTFLDAGKGGVVASYIHSAVAPGLGKIGVLVALKPAGNAQKLEEIGKQVAMHVAAARPEALNREQVDAASLERERNVLKEQAIASGKPVEIAEKMVEGRIRKYYEEVVLLEQIFVIDGKTKVSEFLKDAEKEVGGKVEITAFERFHLGEGVEKEETDFAAEVAAAAGAA